VGDRRARGRFLRVREIAERERRIDAPEIPEVNEGVSVEGRRHRSLCRPWVILMTLTSSLSSLTRRHVIKIVYVAAHLMLMTPH
jgi:hypothetical protein